MIYNTLVPMTEPDDLCLLFILMLYILKGGEGGILAYGNAGKIRYYMAVPCAPITPVKQKIATSRKTAPLSAYQTRE